MINLFEPKKQNIIHKKSILKNIEKVFESGDYILGKEVSNLESVFAKYCKTKYAIAVKNGTDALILALKSLDVKKGDQVITTSHTALATLAAIISIGATPVIVDIEKNYHTIDPKKLKTAMNKKIKAIIVVHIYGQSCDMKSIISITKKMNIPIIEDCSQALGAKYYKKKIGTIGLIGTFSFYPTKNLGAIGDGGMMVTSKLSIAKKLIRLRQYGWNKKRQTFFPGINSRLDELQASILNIKIKNIDIDNQKRIKIAENFSKKIVNNSIELPKTRKNTKHVFHIYAVLTKKRNLLIKHLKKNDIFAGIHYSKPACLSKGYRELCKFKIRDLKNTLKVSKQTLSIPIYPGLSDKSVNKIIKTINKFK
jgi:dTDP-4-amino-4,6-dideoxygalactose transaminase